MTRSYRLTPAARAQLRRSYLYSLKEFGNQQTDTYFAGLRKTFDQLVTFPQLGTATTTGSAVRKMTYKQHSIFYRDTPNGVEIGRIFSGSQDFTRDLATYQREAKRQTGPEHGQHRNRKPDAE